MARESVESVSRLPGGAFSVWTGADQRSPKATQKSVKPRQQKNSWMINAVLPLSLIAIAGMLVLLPTALSIPARLSLFAFISTVILWSTTSFNAAFVALSAVMFLVLTGAVPQTKLYQSLASDVIWLMIGAFILGGAVQHTGLAARLTQAVVARARTVSSLLWLLTTMIFPLCFFIPSTSGRAAVVIPVFRSITNAVNDRRITKAIAILMPTVILVSTIGTLIAAGSHLIANDLLNQTTQQSLSFAQWALYGIPFALASSYISCWVILHLFLDRKRRDRIITLPAMPHKRLTTSEWTTLAVIFAMVVFWLSEAWHGYKIATVTVVGALILTSPNLGVMKWKDALKAVSWNLIIFVGAALVLGKSLIETGAAQWIIDNLFAFSGVANTDSKFLILLILSLISLTSHIYMTSHTARAVALVPAMLYLATSLNLNPVAVLFLSTVGMDYCLTFPVSSKALLMFQEIDGETYQGADLLRFSAIMLPIHLGLILLFYFTYWNWLGLSL
jgi:anion transporter